MVTNSLTRLIGIVALLATASCGGDPATSCQTDDDCASHEQCIGSGGLFFGGRVCAAFGSPSPVFDVGPDAGTTQDGGDPTGDASIDPDLPGTPDLGTDSGMPDLGADDGGADMAGSDMGGPDMGCTPLTSQELCSLVAANCGAVEVREPCTEQTLTVMCGTCVAPATCGGTGTDNVCGCAAESDDEFCANQNAECGMLTGNDSCGIRRTAQCGACPTQEACGAANTCESDVDSDGIIDPDDNCPETPNPGQVDGDNDGLGDACDNCPAKANQTQLDQDQNTIGDACQVFLLEASQDSGASFDNYLNVELKNGYTDVLFVAIVTWDASPAEGGFENIAGFGQSWNLESSGCAAGDEILIAVYSAYGDAFNNDDLEIFFTADVQSPSVHLLVFDNVDPNAPLYDFNTSSSSMCPNTGGQSDMFLVQGTTATRGDRIVGTVGFDDTTASVITPSPDIETYGQYQNLVTSTWTVSTTGSYQFSGSFFDPTDYLAGAFGVRSQP